MPDKKLLPQSDMEHQTSYNLVVMSQATIYCMHSKDCHGKLSSLAIAANSKNFILKVQNELISYKYKVQHIASKIV